MIRNTLYFTALGLGLVGVFSADSRFFIAGGLVAITTMCLRFKADARPPIATDPVEVLENELSLLDDQMSDLAFDGEATEESAGSRAYNALLEKRAVVHAALIEMARK